MSTIAQFIYDILLSVINRWKPGDKDPSIIFMSSIGNPLPSYIQTIKHDYRFMGSVFTSKNFKYIIYSEVTNLFIDRKGWLVQLLVEAGLSSDLFSIFDITVQNISELPISNYSKITNTSVIDYSSQLYRNPISQDLVLSNETANGLSKLFQRMKISCLCGSK